MLGATVTERAQYVPFSRMAPDDCDDRAETFVMAAPSKPPDF
jgi:hypothetical protein